MFSEEEISSQSVSFIWDTVILEEQNGVITSYTVEVSEASNGQVAVSRILPSSEMSLTVNTLLPFTTYLCTIATSTLVGRGPFSQILTLTTLQDSEKTYFSIIISFLILCPFNLTIGPDYPPRNLSAAVLDSRTVLLSWIAPGSHLNGVIQEYRINLTEIETGRVFQEISLTSSATISSLHPDYIYSGTITAFTISEGPYSSILNFTTPEDGKNSIAIL